MLPPFLGPNAPPVTWRAGVPLATLTTLEVGGPARWVVDALAPAAVPQVVAACDAAGVPVLVLGGGSNVLAADAGFPGVVIRLAGGTPTARPHPEGIEVTVAGGTVWDALVAWSVDAGWVGLEGLSGIPGCVGAAPIQNIGAYGAEVGEVLTAVEVYDRHTRDCGWLAAAECGFGYRWSRFKAERDRFIVLQVRLRLDPGGVARVRYAELATHLGAETASPAAVRAAVLAIRRRKSMVLDPDDENRRSAGSFFLNPVVTAAQAAAVAARVPEPMPQWAVAEGTKLSAAWLIERAGLTRGFGEGPVGLSTRHTLALVNRGGATAAQVWAFAERVRSKVWTSFGIVLEPEPVRVGFDD